MHVPTLDELLTELRPALVGWRRHLHQTPELSFEEEETSGFVARTLQSMAGPAEGLEITRPTRTSVMARLRGGRPGGVLAIRADMDGLPIQEENEFGFASRHPGVMHACGHDAHTAMLLGTAQLLTRVRRQLPGEVRFLFQHAEELTPGGAAEMVRAGVMDGVDAVIGAHVWSPLPVGRIGIVPGPAMAAPDMFSITILGKGGHAALPQQTIDPVVVGAQVVTNLQTIVSRATDPLSAVVVSVTQFVAGTARNVIPESARLQGTVRTFDPALRDRMPERMERCVRGVTAAHGADYEFRYERGYDVVDNDDGVTRVVEDAVREALGDDAVDHMQPIMGGEDFSALAAEAPGCFFFVGAGNPDKGIVHPHHHPRFTVDEDALEIGVRVFVTAAPKLLTASAASPRS